MPVLLRDLTLIEKSGLLRQARISIINNHNDIFRGFMIYSLSDLRSKISDLCDDAESLSYFAFEKGFSADVVFGIHDLSRDLFDIFDFIERVYEYHNNKNNI